VDALETKNRKDTMMTESYENWEKGIDWSRRTSVVITAAQAGQAQWACQAERFERSEKADHIVFQRSWRMR
jgi:hypothetical protein